MVKSALIFWFDLFLEARAEIPTNILLLFLVDWKTPKCPLEINWPLRTYCPDIYTVPRPRNSRTLAWVGLVLCSPVALGCGTKDTWMEQKFSRPTRNWNWRKAYSSQGFLKEQVWQPNNKISRNQKTLFYTCMASQRLRAPYTDGSGLQYS